jgi:hypothetical protein
LRISKVETGTEEGTGIETVSFHVTVSASPPLEPLERIAVQVLASRRAGAQDDLIAESSKQMFTVLPANIPVPLAYSPGLNKDKPTVVMVITFVVISSVTDQVVYSLNKVSGDKYVYANCA